MRTHAGLLPCTAGRNGERGFSLIEVAIAGAVLAIVSMGAVVFFRGTFDTMEESASEARVRNAGLASLAHLERDFAHSAPDRVEIQAISSWQDEVRLQISIGIDAAGPIWGAVSSKPVEVEGEARTRHPGWKIRYHVEGTQLLRDLLDEEGVAVPGTDMVVARHLVPESALSESAGGTVDEIEIFRVWQPEAGVADRIFAAVLTTANAVVDARGETRLGSIKLHRTTFRAGRS